MSTTRLRHADSGDEAFLVALFASTRMPELELLPPEVRATFAEQQHRAKTVQLRVRFPDSEDRIVVLDGAPIGRLWIHRAAARTTIVDIALVPEHRRAGLGTALVGPLLAETDAGGPSVEARVFATEVDALRWYARLGFAHLPGEPGDAYLAVRYDGAGSGNEVNENVAS